MKNKITEFIKTKPILAWAIGTVAVALVVACAVSGIFLAVHSSDDDENDEMNGDVNWGEGVTESIPEFEPKSDSEKSIKRTENGVVAYYSEVTGEQVDEYTALVAKECGIKFTGDKYPRSAVYGDRIIAIHYNVTEMKMSVTVVKNSENDKLSKNQQIGELNHDHQQLNQSNYYRQNPSSYRQNG